VSKLFSEALTIDLVGRIYDAATNPEEWPAFLEKFADAVRGESTQILRYDVEHHQGNLTQTVRLDPWHKARYDQHYGAVDAWGAHGRHLMTTGSVVTGQMLCPDAILSKSEFYHDFLRPLDAFHQFCGFIYKGETAVSLISTLRPQRNGPFGDEAVQLLSSLMPHLQRSLQIHRRLAGLQAKANASIDALDHLPIGFLAVDHRGRALLLNRRAEGILGLNDGLTLGRSGLTAARREETTRLRRLVHGASSTTAQQGLESGGAMLISRPSLRRPFQILVTPLSRPGSPLYPQQAVAGVFISDPENHPDPPEGLLGRLFDLTPAEARLAAALMHGKSLSDAAEEFRLSRNTLRTQLRSVLDKTLTRRQSELIRLLYNSPAQIQRD
jgi:DNA-binding CsgD family transcriptional regulator